MTRISDSMDWRDLDRLASDINARLVYRRARCQHGKTRTQSCTSCELGYVDDMHPYADGIGNVARFNGQPCIAVSDDGEDVAYLPERFERLIAKREPIEQLKAYANGEIGVDCILGGPERAIQRVLSRLYNYRLIEMQSAMVHILVPPMLSVDSAAWDDIKGLSPAQARPGVRFLGDGSAVTCHYDGPNGEPRWRRFARG